MGGSSHSGITDQKRAAFINAALLIRGRQDALIRLSFTQNLLWDVVFIVARGHFDGRPVFVTDVCYGVKASKSSVIKTVDRLARMNVIERDNVEEDKRRKRLRLSDNFLPQFKLYIDDAIVSLESEFSVSK